MEDRGATHKPLDFPEDWGKVIGMSSSGDDKPDVIFRLGHMGDVALTTGVLTHWHETMDRTFVCITRAGNTGIFENHPAVRDVIGLEDVELKNMNWLHRARQLAKAYRKHRLIDLHGTLRSFILKRVWRGKVRSYPKFGLSRRLYDLTHSSRLRRRLERTNVPQRYAMAQDMTAPDVSSVIPHIHITNGEQAMARKWLEAIGSESPLVALHPYATHESKQWPIEHWLGLTALLAGSGIDWIIVGHAEEPLFQNHRRDLTNQTSLRETCALLHQADLLVTADSGPMHLATGVGTPVLAMFGPTAKSWGFYPSGPEDQVIEMDLDCRPCSLHGAKTCVRGYECLVGLNPERIMEPILAKIGTLPIPEPETPPEDETASGLVADSH